MAKSRAAKSRADKASQPRKGASNKARQKWTDADPVMRDLMDDYDRKAWRPREPQAIGSIVSGLLARRGYGQMAAADELEAVWTELAGAKLAGQTQLGKVQRGVLAVAASSSAVVQELTFQKARLVAELGRRLPQAKIRDIRIRVAAIR